MIQITTTCMCWMNLMNINTSAKQNSDLKCDFLSTHCKLLFINHQSRTFTNRGNSFKTICGTLKSLYFNWAVQQAISAHAHTCAHTSVKKMERMTRLIQWIMPANWDALVTEDINHRQQNALNQNITEYHQEVVTAQIQLNYAQIRAEYRFNNTENSYQ